MAIMDFINNFRKQAATPVAPPSADDTAAQIASLLQAKTGKGGASATPAPATNIAAQNAANEAAAGMQQQALAGQAQAAAVGQAAQQTEQQLAAGQDAVQQQERMFQEKQAAQATGAREGMATEANLAGQQMSARETMKVGQMNAAYQNAIERLAADRDISSANIWEGFRQSSAELAYRKDVAEMEQIAHAQALSDKKYVMELQTIGATNRLQNDIEWQKEAARLQMGNSVNSLIENLGWQQAFDADEREFATWMGQMDIDQAMKVLSGEIQAANTTAIASGVIQGASKYASRDTTKDTTKGTTGSAPSSSGPLTTKNMGR